MYQVNQDTVKDETWVQRPDAMGPRPKSTPRHWTVTVEVGAPRSTPGPSRTPRGGGSGRPPRFKAGRLTPGTSTSPMTSGYGVYARYLSN